MEYPRALLQPPYTWFQNVDVSVKDFGVPSTVIACELRVWGGEKGSIKINTPRKTGESLHVAVIDGDIFRVEVTKIWRVGTTTSLRNTITIFGFFKTDFVQY